MNKRKKTERKKEVQSNERMVTGEENENRDECGKYGSNEGWEGEWLS